MLELRWLNSTKGEVRKLQYRFKVYGVWTEWIDVPDAWIQ